MWAPTPGILGDSRPAFRNGGSHRQGRWRGRRNVRRLRDAGTEGIVPLVMDMADPSPDRGWRGRERHSLVRRTDPVLSTWLAVVHHICLAGEVPVEGFLDLVAETSPHAVVEFVGPDDPMSRRLMATRTIHRADYTREVSSRRFPDDLRLWLPPLFRRRGIFSTCGVSERPTDPKLLVTPFQLHSEFRGLTHSCRPTPSLFVVHASTT